MTVPASPPPVRTRLASRPELAAPYTGPDRRAPVERPPWVNELEIGVTQALATAERVEAAFEKRGSKSSVGWIAGIVVAALPTFATVYQAMQKPDPGPPPMTATQAATLESESKSLRLTLTELVKQVNELQRQVDRQEGARMARDRGD